MNHKLPYFLSVGFSFRLRPQGRVQVFKGTGVYKTSFGEYRSMKRALDILELMYK